MNYLDEEIEEVEPCAFCPGDAFSLGGLGLRKYYRCRDCGVQFSVTPQDDEYLDEENPHRAEMEEARLSLHEREHDLDCAFT